MVDGARREGVTTQTNTTNAFSSGALRADVLRNPNLPGGQRTLSRWFDTAAFAQPANYTFGNVGINLLRADGKTKFDFSVLRDFKTGEGKRLQFRAEMFNAFNHPDFGLPGHTFGGPGFGIVSSADARGPFSWVCVSRSDMERRFQYRSLTLSL